MDWAISLSSPDATCRLMQEVVTPRYRATSAPLYPSRLTADCDTSARAAVISPLRPFLLPCSLFPVTYNLFPIHSTSFTHGSSLAHSKDVTEAYKTLAANV